MYAHYTMTPQGQGHLTGAYSTRTPVFSQFPCQCICFLWPVWDTTVLFWSQIMPMTIDIQSQLAFTPGMVFLRHKG